MKILITGIGQAHFLNQLYAKVIQHKQIKVDVINLNFRSVEQKIESKKIFSGFPTFKFENSTKNYFRPIFHSIFWKFLFLSFIEGKFTSLVAFKSFVATHIFQSSYATFLDKLEYNYIHHHYLTLENGTYLLYLKKKQIITSFWGSDLFRKSSITELAFKKEILALSENITAATSDMKFHIMTKYGLELREKITVCKFVNNDSYFNLYDTITDSDTSANRRKLFPDALNKKIIAFGHSAFKEDNYGAFLNCLTNLNSQVLSKFHFFFCLTYGTDKRFLIKDVAEKMEKLGCSYTILENYLHFEDLIKYRSCVDAFIFTPTTDAFSGYLTECFYQQIPVFVASWLPYKDFLKMGLQYYELENFEQIPEFLQNMQHYSSQDYSMNKSIIRKNFVEKDDSYKWSTLYK